MSPRGNQRHPVSPADARAYLAKASAWLGGGKWVLIAAVERSVNDGAECLTGRTVSSLWRTTRR